MEQKPIYHKGKLKENIQKEIRLAEMVIEIKEQEQDEKHN